MSHLLCILGVLDVVIVVSSPHHVCSIAVVADTRPLVVIVAADCMNIHLAVATLGAIEAPTPGLVTSSNQQFVTFACPKGGACLLSRLSNLDFPPGFRIFVLMFAVNVLAKYLACSPVVFKTC